MAGGTELSPQARTEAFTSQDVRDLNHALIGMRINNVRSGKQIRIDQADPYPVVGANYHRLHSGVNIDTLNIGWFWGVYIPYRGITQSLITALNQGEKGACVRLIRASKYDSDKKIFIPMPNEGNIANWLGIGQNEALPLQFIDETDMLFLGIRRLETRAKKGPNPDASTDYLKSLIGEDKR